MSIDAPAVAHLLAALAVLMAAAHIVGTLFARVRQPRVIGEIAAGLVLGPTLLGRLAPGLESRLFPATGVTPTVLGAVYQLGLLLLLFYGTQIRSTLRRGESKTVGWVFTTGMLLPFLAGWATARAQPAVRRGPHGNTASFLLVFAIAMAVTSIPVISKIMHDLGILDTAFARVVLGVAVAEDVVLYVILALALGLARRVEGALLGLPSLLRISPGTPADMAYHVAATLSILAVALAFGPRLYRITAQSRVNLIRHAARWHTSWSSCSGQRCYACSWASRDSSARSSPASRSAAPRIMPPTAAIASIERFSFAFFIPIYFAIVGLQLRPAARLQYHLLPALPPAGLCLQSGQRLPRCTAGGRDQRLILEPGRGTQCQGRTRDRRGLRRVRRRHHWPALLRNAGDAGRRDLTPCRLLASPHPQRTAPR